MTSIVWSAFVNSGIRTRSTLLGTAAIILVGAGLRCHDGDDGHHKYQGREDEADAKGGAKTLYLGISSGGFQGKNAAASALN